MNSDKQKERFYFIIAIIFILVLNFSITKGRQSIDEKYNNKELEKLYQEELYQETTDSTERIRPIIME